MVSVGIIGSSNTNPYTIKTGEEKSSFSKSHTKHLKKQIMGISRKSRLYSSDHFLTQPVDRERKKKHAENSNKNKPQKHFQKIINKTDS